MAWNYPQGASPDDYERYAGPDWDGVEEEEEKEEDEEE